MGKQRKTLEDRNDGGYRLRTLDVRVDDFVRLSKAGRRFIAKRKKHGEYFPNPEKIYQVREVEYYRTSKELVSPSISWVNNRTKKLKFPFAIRLKERINDNGEAVWVDYDDGFYSVRYFNVVDENGGVLRRKRGGIR